MGLTFSLLFEKSLPKYQMQILMLGLDAAGKTTILYQLKLGEVVSSVPTIGFNVETVEYKNFKLAVWDLGGCDMRILWRNYFENIEGLIFVVDSSDKERIDCAKEELDKILKEEKLKDIPVLIFANKQDLQGVMNLHEMTEKLGLPTLQRDWFIQKSAALTADGLLDGLDWLQNRIKKN